MNAKDFYMHLLRSYRLGVLAYSKFLFAKIFSRKNQIKVRVPGLKEAVFLRKHSSDQDVFDQVFIERGYDPSFLEGFSPEVIVDAGAYVGYSTIYFASKYPGALIIAIEPEDANFQLLQKNTENYENVKCIQAALWHEDAQVTLSNPTGREWSFQTHQPDASQRTVSTVTVPEIMEKFHLNAIDLLKIDIEGSERELFSENYEWIEECKIIAIELHERFAPYCSKALYSALSRFPFRQYIRREKIFIDLRT